MPIEPFNIQTLEKNSVVLIVGRRNTGKSFLVRDLLYHHRDLSNGIVVSPTEPNEHFYQEVVSSKDTIYEEYTPDLWQSHPINAFIVFDNALYDKAWPTDAFIRRLFMEKKSLFLFTMPFALGIPPYLRTNVDYVFILRDSMEKSRQRLYLQYGSDVFPTFEAFGQAMDECTDNYECLVMDQRNRGFYRYKAEERVGFRMGHGDGSEISTRV
jgi:hypothetical protein